MVGHKHRPFYITVSGSLKGTGEISSTQPPCMLSVTFLRDRYSLVLQMGWFSKMRRRQGISCGQLTEIWAFSHKTVQFGINRSRFHDGTNVSGSFLLSFLWPLTGCSTSSLSPISRRGITRKEAALTLRKHNFHSRFPCMTFPYISVAETVLDHLHIAKESEKNSSSAGYTSNTVYVSWGRNRPRLGVGNVYPAPARPIGYDFTELTV